MHRAYELVCSHEVSYRDVYAKKRKYVDVMRSTYIGLSTTLNIPSIEQLANQKNVLNLFMIEKCKSVKPWVEEFLSRFVIGHCKFPWCNDITVDRSFWNGLCGLDDNRKGWLVDEHIDLWITELWHTRQSDTDWAMVIVTGTSCTFNFKDYMPIEDTHDFELCTWYLKMRECLEEKLHVVLKETGMFEKKYIDPAKYKISFRKADHVSKQGGVFGDCGVFLIAYGVPLAVDDPLQTALAYREKMIHFYFQRKMFCPEMCKVLLILAALYSCEPMLLNSYSCDELVFDVAYNGCFLIYPLKYGGELLQLKLSKVKMLTYFEMCNLLLDKTKHDIWKWFYCNPKCTVENGLTLVENDRDLKKIYEMANLHGLLDVYVSHISQTFLVDYYLKNLCFDDSGEEVSSILRTNEKIKKHIHSMTLEEMIAWEKEESQSPCYLRSPPLKPKNSFKEFKGKALLDDFEDVEGEGEGLGSSSSNFVVSHRSDEIRYDVYFGGCFFMCPLDYQDGHILDLRLPRALDVYVCHVPQPILVDYYFKNLCVVFESDDEVTSIYKGNEKGKVLLDDFESVGFRKGKVLLDDFEAVGNGKDKVDGDDAKDELISTKGDDDPTQEYIRKLIDDVDDDFKRRPWVTTLEFINDGGEIGGGCFGDIKSYIKNGKLEKLVAIITSCKPNVLGDMNVTLKDPSGTMSGTIYYKVLSSEDGYINDIKVGSALILRNVSGFCPKSSNCALNITLKNLVKIFKKDTIVEAADGASGSNI
ncbi:phospholipase-like protein [Tanacetum coccineum]